jgi:hypothetical protein
MPRSYSKNVQMAMAPFMERYYGGGEVLFVGNRSGLPAGDGSTPDYPLSSLVGTGGALDKLNDTTNRGHIIFLLPGSAFSVDAADWASATGTANSFAICALGHGNMRASFTWTTATSTWLIDTDNVAIDNCRLFLAGADAAGSALTVAAPITITGAGCTLRNNRIRFGFDADQLVTVGITTTAAADDLTLDGNHCVGATAAECTTFLDLIGTDNLYMVDNVFEGATSAVGVGIVRFATTAALNIRCYRNSYINRKAASEAAVTGLAGVSGVSHSELFHFLDNTGTTAWETSPGIMAFYNARTVNLAGEMGMLSTVVST